MTDAMIARMNEIKALREPLGFNVHFINDRGERDVFSFNSKERADAFRANLVRNGRTLLDGPAA